MRSSGAPRNRVGILYLVATPIGNLADVTFRGVETLHEVDLIACEDTRHSRALLSHYAIAKPVLALHEHNEAVVAGQLVDRLLAGESVALISDAGTPLISDPGFRLVRMARTSGIRVVPIPGPCALVAALSASGLPADRFVFEGFLPRRSAARRTRLESLRNDPRTLIFYESSHRLAPCLEDLQSVFEPDRRLVIAKELTKFHEAIVEVPLGSAREWFHTDPDRLRGEFVLILEGAQSIRPEAGLTESEERILRTLLGEVSLRSAVSIAAKITGAPRDLIYQIALTLRNSAGSEADGD